jgi:hypothetical protein
VRRGEEREGVEVDWKGNRNKVRGKDKAGEEGKRRWEKREGNKKIDILLSSGLFDGAFVCLSVSLSVCMFVCFEVSTGLPAISVNILFTHSFTHSCIHPTNEYMRIKFNFPYTKLRI